MNLRRFCSVTLIVIAGILSTSQSANAATITLTATDALGETSFASGLHWSDLNPPSAENDYVVDSGRSLRNVADSTGTVTFDGNSLTLGNGTTAGILIFKNLSGATVNVNNLTLNNGEVQAGGTAAGAVNSTTLGGSITLSASATANRFHSGASGRSIIVSAPITGLGSVNFINAGWTQFTNPGNDYSGTSTVSGGMFRAADGASLPTASNLVLNGGIFGAESDFTRTFGTGAGQVQLGGNTGFAAFGATRNVNLDGGSTLTWGTAPFAIGTLILSHAIADATVNIQNPIAFGAATRTIQVDNGSAVVDAELSGALTSTGGGLIKLGAGTLTISSANNTYTGATVIGNNAAGTRIGVIRAAATQALGTGLVTIGIGGNDATARLELVGGASLPNTIDLPGRNNTTVAIQSLSGNNTLAGSINMNSGGTDYRIQSDAGFLTLAGGINIPSVAGNRIVTLQGAGNGEVSGAIINTTGVLNVAKIDGGTWVLSGTNTYAGTTTVTAGTLLVNGNNSGATGAVTVASTGTLGGTGTVGGATTVNGTLAPGTSAESLDFSSTLTLGGASTTTMEIDGLLRGVLDGYDAVNVATTLVYGGTLNIDFSRLFGERSFDLFDFGEQGGNFSAINLTGAYTASMTHQGDGLWTADVNGRPFQFTTGDGVLTMVPEPASAILIVMAAAGSLGAVRRRWK